MSIAHVNSPRKWTPPCLPRSTCSDRLYFWSVRTETQGKFEEKWSWCAPQLHKMLLCRMNAVLHGAVLPASGVEMLLERLTNFRGSRNVGKCWVWKIFIQKMTITMHTWTGFLLNFLYIISLYTIFSSSRHRHQSQTPAFRHYGKKNINHILT